MLAKPCPRNFDFSITQIGRLAVHNRTLAEAKKHLPLRHAA
jgi:hypothetical protein